MQLLNELFLGKFLACKEEQPNLPFQVVGLFLGVLSADERVPCSESTRDVLVELPERLLLSEVDLLACLHDDRLTETSEATFGLDDVVEVHGVGVGSHTLDGVQDYQLVCELLDQGETLAVEGTVLDDCFEALLLDLNHLTASR